MSDSVERPGMTDDAVHPDFRMGFGSLLVFGAVVVGMLGYPFAGGLVLLVGIGLFASGVTGIRLTDALSSVT